MTMNWPKLIRKSTTKCSCRKSQRTTHSRRSRGVAGVGVSRDAAVTLGGRQLERLTKGLYLIGTRNKLNNTKNQGLSIF